MKLKPIELEYLLHCLYNPHASPLADAPIIKEFRKTALHKEILKIGNVGGNPTVTHKGKAWLELLLNIDVPELPEPMLCVGCCRELDKPIKYCEYCNAR